MVEAIMQCTGYKFVLLLHHGLVHNEKGLRNSQPAKLNRPQHLSVVLQRHHISRRLTSEDKFRKKLVILFAKLNF